ncbi:flagellar biosynthesis protein FlhF [Clostridium bowmanii]|uniref:flagellar biosynthesis protein FlhF n=1 Tax=Clostridium bowmanii TaxID=132925 RepID=UPI001C0BAC95|nr:flagellar biosynthesis protein FlhF [Clostridium bowmanii]MBU3190569.1 flagellar biosynthesis protein FlhF [Clostridium bowmanii]MCA1075100.1 flagellar biosynthesis protein FlhF [Clostridium bowmanii]
MIIKRYVVSSMNEAMTRIRYELGLEAVIISQRKIRKPGIKGLFSNKIIEVTAAVENEINPQDDNIKESIEALTKVVQQQDAIKPYPRESQKQEKEVHSLQDSQKQNKVVHSEKAYTSSDNNNYPVDLITEMKEMKIMINELSTHNRGGNNSNNDNNSKSNIEKLLEDNDVDSENIHNIMVKMKNYSLGNNEVQATEEQDKDRDVNEIDASEYEKLKIVLNEMMPVTIPNLKGRIVLVGPTGVGKTTTIAKLAGRLALIERKSVGLITVDTYRIGAVEQLKTYADIMNIPFKVVYNMKDMDEAIQCMSECEVVLIDTTGRSSKNKMQISELRTFVEKADTKNINLVLSSTTKNKDIKSIIEGYQILHYNSIIVTKLDETSTYGSILNILETAKIPLSFVTTGQNVPDDLKELSKDQLVSLILGEDTIC